MYSYGIHYVNAHAQPKPSACAADIQFVDFSHYALSTSSTTLHFSDYIKFNRVNINCFPYHLLHFSR